MRSGAARAALACGALVPLAYQLVFFDRWFSAMDEGHVLLFADLVAGGGELYRDATLYPLPGAFYLLAGLFRWLEPSILLARWVVVVEFCALGVVTVALLLRLGPVWLAGSSVAALFAYRVWAFPHWQMYSYSSLALLLLALAVLAFVRFVERAPSEPERARRWLGAAGLAVGLAGLTKQDYGAAGLLALAVTLAAYARATGTRAGRLYAWLLAPPALAAAVTSLHFAHQGLFVEMARQTVWNHLVGIASFDYSTLPDLWPLFAQDPSLRDSRGTFIYLPAIVYTVHLDALKASWLFERTAAVDVGVKAFFYAPYALALGGAVRLWRRRGHLAAPERRVAYAAELALFATAAALLLGFTLNRPHDWVHLAVLAWPWLPLALVWGRALAPRARAPRWAAAAALAAALVPLFGYSGLLAWRLRALHDTPLASERAGVRVRASEARLVDEVVAHVRARSRPGERVAVLPYFPILSFLADRGGPHRSGYILWPVPETPDRDREIVSALERERTPVVIYNFTQFAQFPPVEEYAPEVFAYLVRHYEVERVFTYDVWGYMLGALRRSDGPPPGRALLSDDGREAVVWTAGPGGPPRALAGAERDAQFRLEDWPFRRVAALRPRSDGGRSAFSIDLDVPEGARLWTAAGVNPQHWFMYPGSAVEFELAARHAGGGDLLYRRRLDPNRSHADRGWHEVDVALDAYAGRRIELVFSTRCERPSGELRHFGGWAVPRLGR